MTRNFAWIANWKITHRCNLRCVYCDKGDTIPASEPERADVNFVLDKIAAYRPKYLNITGGEPTLVDALPRILERARREWNPSVYVVHNGTQPDRLVPLLPYVDRLVVSIDGPGEVNRRSKGIDGTGVLERMGKLTAAARETSKGLSVNCVLTKNTLPHMREMAERVRALSGLVTLCFSPVMPPLDALSVLSDEKSRKTFRETYEDLRGKGYNIVQTFDNVLIHDRFDRIDCFNQYFTIRISPEGKISSCAMNVPVRPGEYLRVWKRALSPRGLRKSRDSIAKFISSRVRSKIDFSCTTICGCESWLDVLFLNKTNESIPIYLRGLAQRISEEELRDMTAFVKAHVNPAFDLAFFRAEMERSLR